MSQEKKLLSIGDLSKLSGVTALCIRAWESRHGIPKAVRLPSGHRRYPREELLRLQLIAQASERGFRIGKLSKMSIEELQALVEAPSSGSYPPGDHQVSKRHSQEIADAIRSGSESTLIMHLENHHKDMGTLNFLDNYLTPILHDIGQLWHDDYLSVAEEHFFSNLIEHYLQCFWQNSAELRSKPTWVIAGLPGDHHEIPLHMSACVIREARHRVSFLGVRTPVDDIIRWLEQVKATGLILAVSANHCPTIAEQQLRELHQHCSQSKLHFFCGGTGLPDDFEAQPSNFNELFDQIQSCHRPSSYEEKIIV